MDLFIYQYQDLRLCDKLTSACLSKSSTFPPAALICFSLNVPAHSRTAYLLGSRNEIELNNIFSAPRCRPASELTYDRTAATVLRISEAVKGSRGWARLGGICLVEERETMLKMFVFETLSRIG